MGQSFQFLEMRKGDVIITRCPKHDEQGKRVGLNQVCLLSSLVARR